MAAFRPLELLWWLPAGHDALKPIKCDPPRAITLNLDAVLFLLDAEDGKNARAFLSDGTQLVLRGTPVSIKLPVG